MAGSTFRLRGLSTTVELIGDDADSSPLVLVVISLSVFAFRRPFLLLKFEICSFVLEVRR